MKTNNNITGFFLLTGLLVLAIAASAFELPYIRSFLVGGSEFRVERNKVQSLNFYECNQAAVNMWKAVNLKYSKEQRKDSAVVIVEILCKRNTYANGTVKHDGDLHAFVYFNGMYFDPAMDTTFKRIPRLYREITRLTTLEDINNSEYL